MSSSRAEVYIIESLDENDDREGEVIYRTLKMSKKEPIYRYIRTRNELEHFLDEFEDSKYRYLHISCHGNRNGVATTLDQISVEEFSEIVGPVLDERRLFLSTCQASTMKMASAIFQKGDAYSIAGPKNKIYFDDSVILWSSFYHLMFKTDSTRMKRSHIKQNLSKSAALVAEKINFYYPVSHTDRRAKWLHLPEQQKSRVSHNLTSD